MKNKLLKTSGIKWEEIQKDVYEKQCIINKNGLNISILKINPHKKISMHVHADTRYNLIIRGSMSDKTKKYRKGDIIINEKGSRHFLKASPEGCEFILIWR